MRGLELLNNISNPSVNRPRWRPNKADIRSKAEINENLPARDVVEFTVEVREAYERRQSPSQRPTWIFREAYFNYVLSMGGIS